MAAAIFQISNLKNPLSWVILSICSANFTVGFPWRPEIRIEMKFPSGPNFYGNLKPPTSFQKLSSAFRTSAVRHVGELIETFFKKSGPDWHFDLTLNGWDWSIWAFRAGIAHIVPKVSFSTFHTQLEPPVSKLYSTLRIGAYDTTTWFYVDFTVFCS